MNQARLDMLIAAGLAQAAQRIGSVYQVFRPVSAFNPTDGAPICAIRAIFDPNIALSLKGGEDRSGSFASLIGGYSSLSPGDYLLGSDTWFVSHIEPLRAAVCVRCNHVVSVKSPSSVFTTGLSSYGGRVPSSDTILASGWPASILTKTHLDMSTARLPGDVRTVFAEILLPSISGLTLSHGQMLIDEFGQTYVVAAAELSVRGWRVQAGLDIT